MRTVKYIVIHCTAGYGDVASIRKFWRNVLGWKDDGYGYFIYTDGRVEQLNPLSAVTNGVKGYNRHAVHIAYQGGVERGNVHRARDTRTAEQKEALLATIKDILLQLKQYQDISAIKIVGHRDFSPDTNGNGVIEPWERIKECPSFDAITEYRWLWGAGALASRTLLNWFIPLLLSISLFACGSKRQTVSTSMQTAEQIKNQRTETALVTASEKEDRTLVKRDSFTSGKTRVYGAKGTLDKNGVFTGSMDSIASENRSLKSQLDRSLSKQKNDSAARAETSEENQELKEQLEVLEEIIEEPPDPVTSFWYTLSVGAAILLLSYGLYLSIAKGSLIKGFLNRVLNVFKKR